MLKGPRVSSQINNTFARRALVVWVFWVTINFMDLPACFVTLTASVKAYIISRGIAIKTSNHDSLKCAAIGKKRQP